MDNTKDKKLVYVVFKIPVSGNASRQRKILHDAIEHLQFSDKEKKILDGQNTYIKQLVLPTFDGKTDVIIIHPQEIDENIKIKMGDNVMRIQDYLKKLNNYE